MHCSVSWFAFFLQPLRGPLFVAVFSFHHVTCGRASTVGQPVRTPCRQLRAGLLLHCSAPESLFCGFLAPLLPTFVNPCGSSDPVDASAGSAIGSEAARREREKAHWSNASFPCALCGRTSNRHSQRTVLSALWPCVLDTCDDVTYSCLLGENDPASSHFSVSVVIKNAF